jgi:predicted nucleic acid-binding protein
MVHIADSGFIIASQRMDWTDACVVFLSELHRHCRVLTVDREDFAIYRRFRNQSIPFLAP